MEIKKAHIKDIYVPPERYEDTVWTLDQSLIGELAEDIRVGGQIEPIIVRPTRKHVGFKYELGAGLHRIEAHKLLGMSKVEAIVRYDLEDDDLAFEELTIRENLFRKHMDDWEEGEMLLRLTELHKKRYPREYVPGVKPEGTEPVPTPLEELAERKGVTTRTLWTNLQIARDMIPELKPKVRAINTTKEIRLSIASLPPERQKRLADKWEIEGMATLLDNRLHTTPKALRALTPYRIEREREPERELPHLTPPEPGEFSELPCTIDEGMWPKWFRRSLGGGGDGKFMMLLYVCGDMKRGRITLNRPINNNQPLTHFEEVVLSFIESKYQDAPGHMGVHTIEFENNDTDGGAFILDGRRVTRAQGVSFIKLTAGEDAMASLPKKKSNQ